MAAGENTGDGHFEAGPDVRWFDCVDGLIVGRTTDVSPRFLNPSGAAIWRGLVDDHLRLDLLVTRLAIASGANAPTTEPWTTIDQEVRALVAHLVDSGLLVTPI